jgi:glycosyltransferase involved in cell wall biosynthesis
MEEQRVSMKKDLKVVHVVPRLFGKKGVVGGAERYALELARYMAEQVPTSLVCFGVDGEGDRQETFGRLTVQVIGKAWCVRGQAQNPMSFRLGRFLRGANIVHCHQQFIVASSFSAALSRLTGKKAFVSDLGGGGWDVSAYVSTNGWYRGHLHISRYSRKVFGQADDPRAHVIWGGVDTEKFRPDPGIQRQDRVLFVGRLLPHKGVDALIRAMPDDLELEIIGQPYDQRYVEELHRLAEGKRVVFRHDCDDETMVNSYRTALCVVLPSVYRDMYGVEGKVPELLGQTLLEGMACGTPAICTDVASMPEVVSDRESGFVVPPYEVAALREKIEWLRGHPAETEAMGKAARDRVLQQFTWPSVVERCLEVYRM